MRGSVITIGPRRPAHAAIDALWSERGVEHQQFTSASAALEVLRSEGVPQAVLICHPLWDSTVEDVLAAMLRILGPDVVVPVVVLAPAEAVFEVAALEDRGVQVLPEGNSTEKLRHALEDALGQAERKHPRFMVRMVVKVEAGTILRACQCEDVSLGGMRLRTREEFPIGAEVDLEFSLQDEDDPIRCRAEVVRYTRPEADEGRGMGVRFLTFDGNCKERLEDFLST